MRAPSTAALLLGLVAVAAPACTSLLGDFDVTGGSTSTGVGGAGGSTATSSGGSTATSAGGAGTVTSTGAGMVECVASDACADMNPCTADSCDTAQGKCVHAAVADGPAPDGPDTPKDCLAPACVNGAIQQVPSDTDVPDDGNLCTSDTCTGGVPMNAYLPSGESCGPTLVCDGIGNCVGCTKASQCPDPGLCKVAACTNQQCAPTDSPKGFGCGNGKLCDGAGSCVECLFDAACNNGKICLSGVCTASCGTGVKDGKETDVDCGGGACPPCAIGLMCKSNSDCATGVCNGNVCKMVSSCFDNIKNGSETDVDCGGSCAANCASGKQCLVNADCQSGLCKATGLCF